jgi:hypothetical protein
MEDLCVEEAAVTEHQAGALEPAALGAQDDVVRGRIVLHLLAGPEVIPPSQNTRLDPNAFASAEMGEG